MATFGVVKQSTIFAAGLRIDAAYILKIKDYLDKMGLEETTRNVELAIESIDIDAQARLAHRTELKKHIAEIRQEIAELNSEIRVVHPSF